MFCVKKEVDFINQPQCVYKYRYISTNYPSRYP